MSQASGQGTCLEFMITGLSSGVFLVGETVTPELMPVHAGRVRGPFGAHLEPIPFLSLVQDRSPLDPVGLSFRMSMPLSAFSSPSSMTSQVGRCPWQHPDQSGDPGLGVVLTEMEMCPPALCERKEDSSAQRPCE